MIIANWTITFLLLALISAILAFTGIAAVIANIAKIAFVIFLSAGVIGVVYHLRKKDIKLK